MFSVASSTRRGDKHALNEDSHVTIPEHGVFAVADGMGGHVDGGMASAIIADRLRALAQDRAQVGPEALTRCVEEVSHDIWSHALRRRQVTGSTIAALLVQDGRFFCLWAGDSRIYHLHGGVLKQLSHDHSEVQELVDHGVLSPDESRSWPRRNVITRALGVGGTVELARFDGPAEHGDAFVLSSDGLTTLVECSEIQELVRANPPQQACDALVDLARQRGETDDVTVVIVHLLADDAATAPDGWGR